MLYEYKYINYNLLFYYFYLIFSVNICFNNDGVITKNLTNGRQCYLY